MSSQTKIDFNIVLVTGGAGYIGSHTSRVLARIELLSDAFDHVSMNEHYEIVFIRPRLGTVW